MMRLLITIMIVPNPLKPETRKVLRREKSVTLLTNLDRRPSRDHQDVSDLVSAPFTLSTVPLLLRSLSPLASSPPSLLASSARRAGAAFRLLYGLGLLTCFFVLFGSADFLPPPMLGSGATANCWTGDVFKETEADNALACFYALVASGHASSFLFSVLISPPSAPSGVRGLGRHGASLALLSSSWLLPPTRRLGALVVACVASGAAAVDAWSLLRACERVPLRVRLVSFRATCACYAYARFYLLPFVVLRSATLESQSYVDVISLAVDGWVGSWTRAWFGGLLACLVAQGAVQGNRLVRMRPE